MIAFKCCSLFKIGQQNEMTLASFRMHRSDSNNCLYDTTLSCLLPRMRHDHRSWIGASPDGEGCGRGGGLAETDETE
jgi:hypothetical protein